VVTCTGGKLRIGKALFRQQISGMSTVAEIESALKKLPMQQAQEIAQWLDNYLKQPPSAKIETAKPAPVKLPDYAARRRQIFGDKVLPNMVLLAREEERW
jgi:hypothetical protein